MHVHTAGFAILLEGEEFSSIPIEERSRIEILVGYDDKPPTDEEINAMPIDGARVYLYHQPCGGAFRSGGKTIRCGKCGEIKPLPMEAKTIANFPNYLKKVV